MKKFLKGGEGNVYFNIREERSVIQASFREGKCNLLKNGITRNQK